MGYLFMPIISVLLLVRQYCIFLEGKHYGSHVQNRAENSPASYSQIALLDATDKLFAKSILLYLQE